MTLNLRIISNRMKAMKNICKLLTAFAVLMAVSACGGQYDPLPPKTDASLQYALPYPEKPSQDEIDRLLELRMEYENAINS